VSQALSVTLRAQGGLLGALADELAAVDAPDASGPRTSGREAEYALLLEMIFEGVRLHYEPWLDDRDLALLLGDQLYALGLVRLAALGDLEAVAELSDVISLVAQAHASGDPDLAQAAWQAGVVAIARGRTPAHEAAKARARAGDPGAAQALREAANPA
jgi:hypothetical protein